MYELKNYDDEKFLPVYGRVFDANRGITPGELLVRGIAAYLAGKS